MTKEQQKEQQKQEFKNDLQNLTEQEIREKWKIGKSLFDKAKKKLGIKQKRGRKQKLDFLF